MQAEDVGTGQLALVTTFVIIWTQEFISHFMIPDRPWPGRKLSHHLNASDASVCEPLKEEVRHHLVVDYRA